VLGIVVLVADGRVAGDVDQAEAGVARVVRNLRQPDVAVEIAPLVLLEDAGRNPVQSEAKFIQQAGREDVRLARHGVLCAPRHVVAEARNGGERRAGEGLVQGTVGKAVAQGQIVGRAKVVVHAEVEMVVAIALGRGGDVILIGHGAVGQRIQRGNRQAHRIQVCLGNDVAGERRLRERIDGQDAAAREIANAL
jgi:hypothetical protein